MPCRDELPNAQSRLTRLLLPLSQHHACDSVAVPPFRPPGNSAQGSITYGALWLLPSIRLPSRPARGNGAAISQEALSESSAAPGKGKA